MIGGGNDLERKRRKGLRRSKLGLAQLFKSGYLFLFLGQLTIKNDDE